MTQKDREIHTVSVFVANKPGALARIAQVFQDGGITLNHWWFLQRSMKIFRV